MVIYLFESLIDIYDPKLLSRIPDLIFVLFILYCTKSGLVKRRWQPFIRDQRSNLELVVKANYVQVNNEVKMNNSVNEELADDFKKFWSHHSSTPLIGRNIILSSFCPQVRTWVLIDSWIRFNKQKYQQ